MAELLVLLVAAFLASKVVIIEDSVVSLSFVMDEVMKDIRRDGMNIYNRSSREKEHDASNSREYRYGFMRASSGSEIGYILTLKAADQIRQRKFPSGYYGLKTFYPNLQKFGESHDELKYGSSQEGMSLRERNE